MYKFRSMVRNAPDLMTSMEALNEAHGPIFKIKNDPRVTPLGRFLRRTSLDELPQLWNVLLGDMSLVGPRPMSVRDVSLFDEPQLMRRFSVRPGITGIWQVSGRSALTFEQWMALDFSYIDDWSLALDLKILARTLPAVFKRSGAV
jgi:lipopolysaccharide/colanic/teichoic acid biosynthesis glycosyltransferase